MNRSLRNGSLGMFRKGLEEIAARKGGSAVAGVNAAYTSRQPGDGIGRHTCVVPGLLCAGGSRLGRGGEFGVSAARGALRCGRCGKEWGRPVPG